MEKTRILRMYLDVCDRSTWNLYIMYIYIFENYKNLDWVWIWARDMPLWSRPSQSWEPSIFTQFVTFQSMSIDFSLESGLKSVLSRPIQLNSVLDYLNVQNFNVFEGATLDTSITTNGNTFKRWKIRNVYFVSMQHDLLIFL